MVVSIGCEKVERYAPPELMEILVGPGSVLPEKVDQLEVAVLMAMVETVSCVTTLVALRNVRIPRTIAAGYRQRTRGGQGA